MTVESKILEMAETHFFRAMRGGYVAGTKGIDAPGMPKYKQIEYESDNFRIVDQYGSSQAGKSEGTTRIWFCGDPVWVMGYGGFYRKEEIPFLKWALLMNYEHSVFNGGRGPSLIADLEEKTSTELIYVNWASGNFEKFSGREEIRSPRGTHEPHGWHNYWGMALI